MSYIYIKKIPPPPKNKLLVKKKKAAGLLLTIGLIFFLSVIIPIVKFQFQSTFNFHQMINPLSLKSSNSSTNILGDISTDYTQISNWFVTDTSNNSGSNQIFSNDNNSTYLISIPKLKIKDAIVAIGSMDLKKSLIQYPQTALPGQVGNAVIFGHSVLPQFFNSKNYLTIFSTLYRLKQGDEIQVDFNDNHYKYVVDEMYEVKPTNLSVLDQRLDQKNLTLITCSPPGTYLRRLVIKASIAVN